MNLKTTVIYSFLVFAFYFITPGFQSYSQDSSSGASTVDVSDKNLKTLYKLQDYYRAQLRKEYVSGEMKDQYKIKLDTTEKEIVAIREKRIDHAKKRSLSDPTLIDKEKFNFQFRDMDLALTESEPPRIYACETKSLIVNVGISFLSINKYSVPFTVATEKFYTQNISLGGYIGQFVEKIRVSKLHLDSNAYFASNTENYKHNYFNFGLKGSYHYINPLFILNPDHFDLYASALLGYILAASTHPFLENEKYLPYTSNGTPIEPGTGENSYLKPNKKGINYGAFVGLRYMYDNNLGFFAEAGYSNTGFITGGITLRFLEKNTTTGLLDNRIEFKVKILASEQKKKPDDKLLKEEKNVEEISTKNGFIYVVSGENTSYAAAEALKEELSQSKFKKAEVIAIKNHEVIRLKKAIKLTRKTEIPETEIK